MGGGDLNLKKSWHPNTMKNMERVWKAEQKDNEEKKRIAELQREIHAERDKEDMQKFAEDTGVVKKKDDVKLEWMYKGPSHSVNHEDYLLGKAIDKNFERHQQEQQRGGASTSQDEERVPDAIRQAKSSVFSEQVDVARKMNEDPLMAIRQRAVEKAKQLYDNPVRLKQLQKMIASKSLMEKKHKKDKKKKKKKSKKSSKKEEDKELNALLTEKLKSALQDRELLRKLKEKASKSSDSSSSDNSSSESDDETADRKRRKSPVDVVPKRSHSPKYSKDNRRNDHSSSYNVHRDGRRQSRSPKSHKSRNFNDNSSASRRRSRSRSRDGEYERHSGTSKRRNSRSRSRDRQNSHNQREQSKYSDMKSGRNTRRSNSPQTTNARKHFPEKKKNKDRSPSSENDTRRKNVKGRRSSSSSSSSASDHQNDSDDDHKSKKRRTFGLVMADGSRPVPKSNPHREVQPAVQPQKPNPPTWQRKERVKLSEEEKERRRQEMLQNASWRDKEREANVKRYRKEDDREKKELHENFDEDFARKQFSKAANQASVEGRIKSKLNTIQRSKMSMDQNFARR
ncbi:pre-mRNA-splicing factor CWC25 homolog [Thrips palmi]|uniref:Pre-mRNA-splicing factor CWC25 homolog n=1 Tax=Thrips palmi TaxID=161013 RepID=A0A6P8Y2I5_THRPL|nr:pre-mRNA-splicing factor CWC25 homolog [Thrips palmi]XP_034230515.1 pre-mRNA-splicing factor CWC25 homolog [Thrips palmi]